MVEHVVANTFLFLTEAVVFGVLSFLLWQFYRGYGSQYVKLWIFSLGSLCVSQLVSAIQSYTILQPETSNIQVFYEAARQIAYFQFIFFWLLGLFAVSSKKHISIRQQFLLLAASVALGVGLTLICAFSPSHVYDRFFLRETIPSFLFFICCFGAAISLYQSPKNHFSNQIMMGIAIFLATKFFIFSTASTLWLEESWFQYLSLLLGYVDVGAHAVIGFAMLIWMQGSERNVALTAVTKAQYLGKHDRLTGSLNREQVIEKMPALMSTASEENKKLCIFLIDIKRFKFINDTYGLKTGDHILGQIAKRLRESLFQPLIVGRLSGDSFVYVFEFTNEEQIPRALTHLHELIERLYQFEGQEIFLQASIGYCFYPEHGVSAEDLLQYANLALYHAESRNEPSKQFSHDMQVQGRHLLAVEKSLKSAMTNDEFELYYQPQLNLLNNKLEGVEALIRWNHPEQGFLTPDKFLTDIDTLALNSVFDNYVLEKACQAMARWHEKYNRRVAVAVNITAVEFQDPQLISRIQSLLHKYQIPSSYLELEITENVVMTELESAMNTIVVLQNMGIKVSIDDFGTGYSSLAYLRKLPIDKIKIDRSFISEMAENDSDLTIVKSMIKLSHGLGKRVLAEGVETEAQLNILRTLQCDAVQGYYISKPIGELDLVKYFTRKA